jgi:hypothetical protein
MKPNSIGQIILTVVMLLLFAGATYLVQAAEPTTSVHIIKYASDGITILDETTVDYAWMEANLPVQGDGVTHYYHQGPVFEGDKWDPEEMTNLKDKGAVMGTDIKDLCELVGGMSPGGQVTIHAVDGYYVEFGYANVYEPLDRQGPIVLCWYNGEEVDIGEHYGKGYPPSYYNAMQLVFMAETTNAEGKYVFGNWDMHECLPMEAQYFYGELYPSTNGLSVKWVDEIRIYTGGMPIDPMPEGESTSTSGLEPWLVAVIAIAGLLLVAAVVYGFRKVMSK